MTQPKPGMDPGVLYPLSGQRLFRHARFSPCEALAPFVEHYWTVEWHMPRAQTHVQETIPYPCVHMAFEQCNSEIVCVLRSRFQRLLQGSGRVFAIKFRPGGFYPFMRVPMRQLLDQRLPVTRAFPRLDIAAFEHRLFKQASELSMAECIENMLLDFLPPVDPRLLLVHRAYAYARDNKTVHSVRQVSGHLGVSERSIQRLFACYVGVPPKWVIRRLRLHNAMDRITSDPTLPLADLAAELGYADQAHFARDFKTVVGVAPQRYARSGL